ncbi:bifunctional 2-polyprenyl-6-hydroxyphenol methylase/3-demethylubiquinol 3-O-methyltransferase UbiG [Mycobacterium sp. E787]|uniref:class I SAM-dependent methyltransferase n=1 Tax=Mycobacterium sp. E787 TaxID=1834150 RepID=UPI0007FBE0BA|nr:class I SAM-dependent methyltransferase [Mycobacterium sp. E787]OBI52611.1 methyltransferase type 12 [Mycobacterium sp. E787]
MENPTLRSFDPAQLREPMARRLHRRAVATGQIRLPAVPGMLDEYVRMCDTVFAGVGVRFTAEELAQLRAILEGQLAEAYAASSRSDIVISYESPVGKTLNYHVKAEWRTLAETYDDWVATRQPPLFGTEPDARVWSLAGEAADPGACRVLDVGAGTGRNALALARRGHPVDAVEMTSKFADILRSEAARESLDVRVIERDVFASTDALRCDYQLIVLSEVVPDFRTTQQLRSLFQLAARCLAPGGRLVFNTFLARPGYTPDQAAIELAQQTYSMIFTRDDMTSAVAGLPLELVADDSVYDYEQTHLPAGAWPPTGWYAEWVSGLDVFDVEREDCPIDMRWLVYQKPGGGGGPA